MKTTFCAIAILILAAPAMHMSADDEADGYKLVWADEFNRDGRPDPNH